MTKEQLTNQDDFIFNLQCSNVISYYNLQNKLSPIKRLYIKNATDQDKENVVIKIYSNPAFLLPLEINQDLFPRKANIKFDDTAQLSPIFMVSLDKHINGEIIIEVLEEDKIIASTKQEVQVLAFNECNYQEKIESIATFVKKTQEVNKLTSQAHKRLESWNITSKGIGYIGTKNAVRNYFAACYSELLDINFLPKPLDVNDSFISPYSKILSEKIATSLEAALLMASLLEANGYNPLITLSKEKWYCGVFLTNECFNNVVNDDISQAIKKMESGVNEISMISIDSLFDNVSFEKSEKTALNNFKKNLDVDFILDIKRARILRIFPLPQRVKTSSGYDIIEEKDLELNTAPKQIREFKGDIAGDTTISREKQWERRLLELDMRNSLLNFRANSSVVKILTASLEDFISNIGENKEYTIEQKPKDSVDTVSDLSTKFDTQNYLKPMVDYVLYEYKNKRLRTLLQGKDSERALLAIFKKEQTILEESGAATLYLASGFLRWKDPSEQDPKYAPLFLYPVSLSKKGISNPVFTLTVNSEDIRINCTLLEFLFQEFSIDMRGLSSIDLSDPKNIISIIARIKKEIVNQKEWAVVENVFLSSLSFSNYLMWFDVRNKTDRFKNHKITGALIKNRLELPENNYQLSDSSSDEAYLEDDSKRIYLPISADSSQFSAIKDSLDKSFVLHGPPGTGKSQTITNIIANNIVRGKRVLFVAEKMAALSVVHKRLKDIGIGDFCLELHSDKTNKHEVIEHIINTLQLSQVAEEQDFEAKNRENEACINKLQAEIDAMHKKRYLGFSMYQAIISYFENEDAPDCLHIESMFFEKLTAQSFNKHLEVLTELSLRAKEAGDINKSPFRHVGEFTYSKEWERKAEEILDIFLQELRNLKEYAKLLIPKLNIRTVSLTREKLIALYNICSILNEDSVLGKYFVNYKKYENPHGTIDSYKEALRKQSDLSADFKKAFNVEPFIYDIEKLQNAIDNNSFSFSMRKIFPKELAKEKKAEYAQALLKWNQITALIKKRECEIADILNIESYNPSDITNLATKLQVLFDSATKLYADYDDIVFCDSCANLIYPSKSRLLEYYCKSYNTAKKAKEEFKETFYLSKPEKNEDINSIIDYTQNIKKNLTSMPSWCKYQQIVSECKKNGFDFILEPLSTGEITANDILRSFKKSVYSNFVKNEIFLDDVLCQFSGLTMENIMLQFKTLSEEYEKLTRNHLYAKLCANLPKADSVGDVSLERVTLFRTQKNYMKGTTIRSLFQQIPTILKATCPCMLMSPTSVSQFLDIDMEKFDLVVFDEASQIPTSKAIGSIVRAENVIIVGDPQQLPPTSFFASDYKDDQHYEVEDLESILDDCLALGMPQRHLLWHYRSSHESLIAFSNATFYDNTLLTFPSPNELNSRVTFEYVDGIYERGGSKCNKKEGDTLIKEVIARLKDPATKAQSIGIVTFNTSQQQYIEDKLSKEIYNLHLESVAYQVDEPIFVKNLENVQGDERDVILFSVGFAPDQTGKLSLNFGPINQVGGYKRLNVAVTRARCEMKVFSGITGNMIDLNRTESRGVKSLKAFLEYAERGKEMLAIESKDIASTANNGIGKLIADDLKDRGIICDYNLGVSDFKIDVAVVDPRNKDKYILAIICDGDNATRLHGVKDRIAMQTKILKKLGWNTYYLWTVNYFNNPKKEISKIKDAISALTARKVINKKIISETLSKYRRPYKQVLIRPSAKAGADYVQNFANEETITAKIKNIIEIESPIDFTTLLSKIMLAYNLTKVNKKAVETLTTYIEEFATFKQEYDEKIFYVNRPVDTFRPNDLRVTRDIAKMHPQEVICAVKCAIDCNLNITKLDAVKEVYNLFNVSKKTKTATEYIEKCIDKALAENQIMQTIDGYLSN